MVDLTGKILVLSVTSKKCPSDSTNKFQNFIEWLNRLTHERRKLWQMETALCFHVLFQFS
jgi:hypothetical protein